MATTPLSTASVAYPGLGVRKTRDAPAGLRRYWLGRPGNMIELPSPKIGRTSTRSSGESNHTSLGGVTTVYRRPAARGNFPLEWQNLTGRDWAIIWGFYRRQFGQGPWAYFPPEDVNRIGETASLCTDPTRWGATGAGAVTAIGQATSPILPSGVLRWATPAAGDVLFARALLAGSTTLPDVLGTARHHGAVPYLPGEPVTVSAWVWASAARTARLRLSGRTSASAVTTEADQPVSLTTTPQRVTLTLSANAFDPTTIYLVPAITPVASGSADLFIAAPQLEYASAVTDWQQGSGVPRVVMLEAPTRELDARLRGNVTATLVE